MVIVKDRLSGIIMVIVKDGLCLYGDGERRIVWYMVIVKDRFGDL